MKSLFAMPLLALVCFPGCTRRVPPNENCQWPPETAISFDLSSSAQRQHLSDDAQTAEDLAIRFADSHYGTHSGHFSGFDEYGRKREQCMAALFEVIGKTHGVTQAQVRESLAHRRTSLDLAVILSFAVLYGFAASVMARRVWRRFPPEEGWIVGAAATLVTSAFVSMAGILVGEVWSEVLEQFRLGNGHLSYRADRIPWHQHRLGLFVCGVVIFWIIAALRRADQERTSPAGHS
jgi:hypothetical protein